MATGKAARKILQRADETLFTASLGLEHTKGKKRGQATFLAASAGARVSAAWIPDLA